MQVSFNAVHHLRWPAESLLRYNHKVLSFLPDLIPFGAAFLIDYLRLYLACFPPSARFILLMEDGRSIMPLEL
jgi:hypothetical protein